MFTNTKHLIVGMFPRKIYCRNHVISNNKISNLPIRFTRQAMPIDKKSGIPQFAVNLLYLFKNGSIHYKTLQLKWNNNL